ncbi:MAG TPA: APC family permease [Gemmatimonadales bacterium]|nr:APC family permease [Gemmatimonadales bacterium]
MGTRALAASAVNLTVGGGIFVLPGVVAGQLGSGALAAYAVCAIAMTLVLLCYAEAGSRVASSGGASAYVEAAFGPYAGFLVGTLFWFGYAAASDAAISLGFLATLAVVVPALDDPPVRITALAVLLGGLIWLNIRGVRQGVRTVELLTLVKLVPLVALVVFGMVAVAGTPPLVELPSTTALGAASLTIFFAFSGPDAALGPSAEIVDAPRTVPRAMLLAVLGIVALYAGLHFVAQGLLGADLAKETAAPLAAAAGRLWGPAGRTLLLAAAALSVFVCVAGDLLATPRALMASARQGGLPARFGAVHPRYRTPYVAIATFGVVIFLLAVSGTFERLIVLASAALLVVYGATVAASVALRRRDVRAGGPPLRTPGGYLIPTAAATVVLWLLSQTTWRERIGVAVLLTAASGMYAFRRFRVGESLARLSS